MLRRAVAIILLTMIGIGFYGWSRYKSHTVNELNRLLDSVSAYSADSEYEKIETTLKEIKELYDERQPMFNLACDHEFMNTLSDYISEAEAAVNNKDRSRLDTSIAYMRNHINDFYNDSKITFSNII